VLLQVDRGDLDRAPASDKARGSSEEVLGTVHRRHAPDISRISAQSQQPFRPSTRVIIVLMTPYAIALTELFILICLFYYFYSYCYYFYYYCYFYNYHHFHHHHHYA